MTWAEDLEVASFRGVEFGTVSVDDQIERRTAEHEFPYRNGATIDDLGRRARPTRLTAVFHGPDYLTALGAFTQIVDDGQAGLFRHPLLGSWNARIKSANFRHSHQRRNHVEVDIELREDGAGTELPDLFSIDVAKDELAATATATRTEATEQGISTAEDAADAATSFAATLETTLDDVTRRFEQVRDAVNTAISDALAALTATESYRLVKDLRKTALKARQLKDSVERLSPKILGFEVPVGMPLRSVSNRLYGKGSRIDELATVNRLSNTFIVPAGSKLKVFDR